jgi:hypothetical protein
MLLLELAVPAASAAAIFAFVRRAVRGDELDHDRALRLFAGIAHIVLRDKRSRARRAMDVLRMLGRERLAAARSRAAGLSRACPGAGRTLRRQAVRRVELSGDVAAASRTGQRHRQAARPGEAILRRFIAITGS